MHDKALGLVTQQNKLTDSQFHQDASTCRMRTRPHVLHKVTSPAASEVLSQLGSPTSRQQHGQALR